MKSRTHIHPLDIFLFAVSLAACIFTLLFIKQKHEGSPLLIIDAPDGEYVYSIDKPQELKMQGEIGISVIKIENGKAWFEDSPCPNKTCTQCRPISSDGEWIACMPNQIFIRIENKQEKNKVDIVAQ